MSEPESTVVRALRVEIARPDVGTWNELGVLLRTQRRIMSQLLRAGMDARIAIGVIGSEAAKAKLSPDTRGGSPDALVYQAIGAELRRIQDSTTWREDSRPALAIPAAMISELQRRVGVSYKLRASFGGAQPIPVRAVDTKIAALTGDDGRERIVLEVKLTSVGTTRLVVRGSRGSHWHTLRQLARGELKHGDCRLVLDEDRRKWYALIAYQKPVAEIPGLDKSRALIVHRGVRNALSMMTTTGAVRYESGAKLFAQLRGLDARLAETKRIGAATLGTGARGHGKSRRYECYEALGDKRARVVRTWSQQMAAFVVKVAAEHGCGTVVIESYGGIEQSDEHMRRALHRFPLSALKQQIVTAIAAVAGVEMIESSAEYVSSTCPACGNQDFRQHNVRTGVFHCAVCRLERPSDFVALLHMLRRSGVDASVWDERMRKFAQLRDVLTDQEASDVEKTNHDRTTEGRTPRAAHGTREGGRKAVAAASASRERKRATRARRGV